MASSPLWKLRRLAPRASRVCARRQDIKPILALSGRIVAAADAYTGAYDVAARYSRVWLKETQEGRTATSELVVKLRSWLPLAVAEIPAFSSSTYTDRPGVPDDVIEDASRFLDEVADAAEAGAKLDWAADATADLEPAIAKTIKEQEEAEAADQQWQRLLATTRETAQTFDGLLQTLRRILAAAVGRKDRDYQRLRAEKVTRTPDEGDDEVPVDIVAPAVTAEPSTAPPSE